tara:strand:- start:24545 stop:25135 length:591 start_codon:yes stop_codon:yes gene_type:complete
MKLIPVPTDLKTGDIVLFSGRCKVARTIQLLTWCKWSHVGMIIIDDEHGVLCYESTHNDRVAGVYIKRKIKGVHAVPLNERLSGYKGDMAIQRLCGVNIIGYDLDRFHKFREDVEGTEFEKNFKEPFLSMFKSVKNIHSEIFMYCTELLGLSHVKLGVLESNYPVHKITPADYAKGKVKLRVGYLDKPDLVKEYSK